MAELLRHRWDLEPSAGISLQHELAGLLDLSPLTKPVRSIAGIDVSIRHDVAHAAVVVMSCPDLVILEQSTARAAVGYPYVPGLLSFREAPTILEAYAALASRPDLLMFDGNGYAHPRRLGIASHLGLWLGVPAIGCAKSRLLGSYQEPEQERGAWTPWLDGEEIIGAVVRTRTAVSPVFVSAGHLINLQQAIQYVFKTCTRYRLPEPVRQAHRVSTRFQVE
ncbi:MAG: deoxyribonuclease V [Anaerolineae bacterium]|jgi:deoxyribonuclease V|nr:deoxyribonuclease V [Chloroflexota bacterium]